MAKHNKNKTQVELEQELVAQLQHLRRVHQTFERYGFYDSTTRNLISTYNRKVDTLLEYLSFANSLAVLAADMRKAEREFFHYYQPRWMKEYKAWLAANNLNSIEDFRKAPANISPPKTEWYSLGTLYDKMIRTRQAVDKRLNP